ncbi:universal stress protein, partial [Enterobacter hormaechei]|nr:universal stress protein [Enterobacter hormaechei]
WGSQRSHPTESAMIRHLLVAHDLTPEADVALARAAQLARQHDARVSLLHV